MADVCIGDSVNERIRRKMVNVGKKNEIGLQMMRKQSNAKVVECRFLDAMYKGR